MKISWKHQKKSCGKKRRKKMGLEILELVIVCLTEVMNTVERLEEKK